MDPDEHADCAEKNKTFSVARPQLTTLLREGDFFTRKKTMELLAVLVLYFVLSLSCVHGYAEPPTLFHDLARAPGSDNATAQIDDQYVSFLEPAPCGNVLVVNTRAGSGGGPKTLRIRLRAESDRVACVDVRVRSAHGAAVWYYEVPPPAEAYFERVCLPEDETTPGEVRGADFGGAAPRSRRRTALEVQFPWEAVAGGAAVVEADEVSSSSTSARKVVYDQVKAVRISAISYDSSGRVLGEDRIFATVGGTAGAASSSSFSLMSDSEQEAGALSTEDERHIRDYLIEEENERRTADEKMRHMAEKFQGLVLAASSEDADRGRLTAVEASEAAAIFDGGHLLEQILQQQNDHASPASTKAVSSSSGSSGAASSPSSSDEQESPHRVDVLRLVLPRTASLATAFDFLLNRTGVAIGLPQELEYSKPNGMNEHGVVLREILPDREFESVVGNFLMRSSVLPAAKQLYPEYGTFYVDRVHAFVLFYGGKYDRELKMHMDGAEVTFNVCLEKSSDATYEDELIFGRKNGAGGGAGRRLLKARQTQRGMKREVVTLPRELAGGRENVDEPDAEDDEAVTVLEVALQDKNTGERGKTESFLQDLEPVEGGGGGKNRERGAARTTSKSHRPEARFFSEPNVGYLFLGQQNHGVANRNEGKAEAGRDGKRISLVLRLLSTEFRRSPATGFYLHCTKEGYSFSRNVPGRETMRQQVVLDHHYGDL